MNRPEAARALGLAASLVGATLLASCSKDSPSSLLLRVDLASGVAAPTSVRVRVFDGQGTLHDFRGFPAPMVASGGEDRSLGTVVIYPRPGNAPGSLQLRIQAQGLTGDAVSTEGSLSASLRSGAQVPATLLLDRVSARKDQDGDGVPDPIDNCPAHLNPLQQDRNADGRGDACDGGDGGVDGNRPDGAGPGPADGSGSDAGPLSDADGMANDAPGAGGAGGDDGGGAAGAGGAGGTDPGGSDASGLADAPDPVQPPTDAGDKPPLKPNGAACDTASTCESGACVDAVCCETACTGTCRSCNLPGSAGRCALIAAGQPDHSACAPESPESCGRDGTCDGSGACRRHQTGTVCSAARCSGASERVMPGTCDGAGVCATVPAVSCAPYACNEGACRSSCNGPADCSAGNSCNSGSCGKKPLGAACSAPSECHSANCVDGACCDVAQCSGPCRSCNLPGAAGSCRNFAANSAPRNTGCAMQPPESCGRTGRCDGNGGCQLAGTGTTCAGRTCSGSTETAIATCDGQGACIPGATRSCGRFNCRGGSCATSCSSDGDCTGSNFCQDGGCVARRSSGSSCSAGGQCNSGNCVDGRCCVSASCSGGATCTGSGGTCVSRRALGASCATALDCQSGSCSDGVCCESACTQACRRCNSSGSCVSIMNGDDPLALPPCLFPLRCAGGSCR